jgi:putative transferase (TIGR04331 family)
MTTKFTLLITTALPNKVRFESKNIIFLGEWCKNYSKNNVYSDESFTVIPYHWKDRKKCREDYEYLSHLYQKVLIKVSLELNSVHKVSYSLEYWRIIIGPWLLTYVAVLFDRWESIRLSTDIGIPLQTIVPSSDIARSVAYDYRFSKHLMTEDDEWNYLLYCDILQLQNSSEIELIREDIIFKKKSISINMRRRFKLLPMIAKLMDYIARKLWFTDRYNILLFKSYFPIKGLMRLNIKLKQIPRLHLEFEKYIPCEGLNSSMRSGLHEDPSGSKFENFLIKNIFRDMPQVYMEGYKDMSLYCKKLPEAKVIFTANAHYGDEVFKNWTARQVENGSRLIIGEHGGSIPKSKSDNFNHEEDISCKKTVWHTLLDHSKHVSMPINIKINKSYNLKGTRITLIGLELPRYSYRIDLTPLSSLIMDDFEQKTKFINALNKEVKIDFKIRGFQNKRNKFIKSLNKKSDINFKIGSSLNGWSLTGRYADMYGDSILSTNKTIFQDILQSKIIICTYPSTTLSEAMHSDVPTILLYTEELWDLHPDFNELITEMKRVNIIHSDPIVAANHINMVHENPFEWWNRDDTVRVRNMFSSACSLSSKNPIADWADFFKKELLETHNA